MNKLRLSRFKAFETDITISLGNRKNLLVYGENGAGKSSVYESIKVLFFRNKMESELSAPTPEDVNQLRNELWNSYNNKKVAQDFEIEINDTAYKAFVPDNYQVFMISIEELVIERRLHLKKLLKKFYFSILDVDDLCHQKHEQLQIAVNECLSSFKENVTIEIDEEDDYTIKIIDASRNLECLLDIKRYFNEAKLNVILLLLLLNAIQLAKIETKSKILVLDDFITSLDISNRSFIVRYIFENFADTQIIILTHNISFYNLIMYVVNDVLGASNKWEFCNLFEIGNIHKVYVKSEIERAVKIKTDFDNLTQPASPGDIESIGNRIRKKFETLLYEYSKLVMIGTVEDSKKILERIVQGKSAYYNNKSTASDLIDEMEQVLLEGNPTNLTDRLQSKINSFKKADYDNFRKILKELKLYQKVTMHPMSHGVNGMPTFTVKELRSSIELLEKLEDYLKDLVNSDVVAV